MAQFQFQNDELEYVDEYYEMTDFDEDEGFSLSGNESSSPITKSRSHDPFDSDLEVEDDFVFDSVKSKTDTTALEARKGKDIQGIPWERLNFSRDKYRETRLKQYKNFESLPSSSRDDLDKVCKKVEKGHNLYEFQFNTRIVKSTIVHFQVLSVSAFSFPL